MADRTSIEWTDATVNAINGCTVLSPGCKRCYAMKQAHRIPFRAGLVTKTAGGMVWNGEVYFHAPALILPLKWRRPRRIFWNAHGDTFHDNVPTEWIDQVFMTCALTPQHVHQILTKRSARMRAYLNDPETPRRIMALLRDWGGSLPAAASRRARAHWALEAWPLRNVWMGVSVEDQPRANERIPDLLHARAAVRFLSMEPLLGAIDLRAIELPDDPECSCTDLRLDARTGYHSGTPHQEPGIGKRSLPPPLPGLDWVIVGGESGHGARPLHHGWVRDIWHACVMSGVAFFFKQWGEWAPVCDIDSDVLEALYDPPPEHDPEGRRRCRVEQLVLHADGRRFELDCWSRENGARDDALVKAFQAGQDGMLMMRIGKKRAGRKLYGNEYSEMPR
jgi:protein gp37